MTKTVDKTSANPGDTLTYTVTLTNNQPNSDNNVSVEDFLPAGVTLVSATADQGNVDTTGAPTIAWDVGDIAAGDTVTLTIVVTVDADAPTTLRNRASKRTGAQPFVPPDNRCAQTGPTQNDACVTTTVAPEGTYVLTKTVDRATAQPGDTLTYTITVSNPDGAIAGPVTLADTLPSGVTYVSSSASPTPPSTVTGPVAGVLTWSFAGGLPADSTAVLTVVVTVDANAPATLTDRVGATAGPTPDVPANNRCGASETEQHQACVTTTVVRPANITIVKRADRVVAYPGQTVHYAIRVTNNSTFAVNGVRIDDDLSDVLDDARYNSDAQPPSVTLTGHVLSWTGNLAAGQTVVITYSVTVKKPDKGDHRLFNTVTSPTATTNCPAADDLTNRQADPRCSALVRIGDLHVVKRADVARTRPGRVVRYLITVTNRGALNYSGSNAVRLVDYLVGTLDGARYNGDADASTGLVRVRGDRLTWRGALIPGESATITYSVTVVGRGHGKGCAEANWGGHRDGCGHGGKKLLFDRVVVHTPGSNCGLRRWDSECVATVRVAQVHHRHYKHYKHHGHHGHHGRRELAYTGAANVTPLVFSGLGLLAGGLLLLVAARPRRRRGEA